MPPRTSGPKLAGRNIDMVARLWWALPLAVGVSSARHDTSMLAVRVVLGRVLRRLDINAIAVVG